MSGDVTRPHPLMALVGTWAGTGRGIYPTIESFDYLETITVTAPPKPFLVYQQTTRAPSDGRPLHTETGYLRLLEGTDDTELTIAQPTGFVEVHTGTVSVADGRTSVHLRSVFVARTPSAKQVDAVERRLLVENDLLTYELHMAAMGQPMQLHLAASLSRQL